MNTLLPKFLKLGICLAMLIGLSSQLIAPIGARSLEEIQKEIEQKNGQLTELQKDLSQAEKDLQQKKQTENSANSEVAKLQAEIDRINADLKYNQLRSAELAENKKLKELEKEEQESVQDQQVNVSYISWKTGSFKEELFGGANIVRNTLYNETLNTKGEGGILGIAMELEKIKTEYDNFQTDSASLQTSMEELAKKKAEAEEKLSAARQVASASSTNVKSLRTQSSSLQSQISQLTEEQRAIQDQEKQSLNNNTGGATQEIVSGELYFSGQGRDLYQGHGVGMSQFGALGAALAGWDYKKIVSFYFPNTSVGNISLPSTITVNAIGPVPVEDYVAGAGEVPDKACEDLGIAFNPNNVWACWPKQAILAQMVVYRTYGARRSGFVYGDTRGQVYKGGSAKKWAAEATKGQTVVYNGGLADVYYSSDNNQGRGNANNDTVWSNMSGDGSNIPYLRSVNDNSFAFKTKWTTWGWRTNSYKLSELNNLISWAGSSSDVSSSSRNFIAGVKTNIGTLKSISFERDPSNLVKKVVLTGDKGTRKIAGWLFKSIWNIWVDKVRPSGQADYIYSLTFYLQQK